MAHRALSGVSPISEEAPESEVPVPRKKKCKTHHLEGDRRSSLKHHNTVLGTQPFCEIVLNSSKVEASKEEGESLFKSLKLSPDSLDADSNTSSSTQPYKLLFPQGV